MTTGLFWVFVYNVVGIPVAAGVLVPGLRAPAVAHPGERGHGVRLVSVAADSLRLEHAAAQAA